MRPVIVLGAARSGTTMLTKNVLAQHPELAYYGEPDHVWSHGNAYKLSDVLTEEDLTPRIRYYIRERFRKYKKNRNCNRILIKSPADTLRVSFILKVFPKSQIIHLIRDGRDVAFSARKEWQGKAGSAQDSRGRRQASYPVRVWKTATAMLRLSDRVHSIRDLLELPAYAVRFLEFMVRMCTGSSRIAWGPRFPGIRFVRQRYSLLETCAIQWSVCVSLARSGCAHLSNSRYREVRYENFIRNPELETGEILSFLDLSTPQELLEEMTSVVVRRQVPKWPDMAQESDLRAIESVVGSTLQHLGYQN